MPPPSAATSAVVHTSFYRFTQLPDPEQVAAALRALASREPAGALGGSILVAAEGINGMLGGPLPCIDRFEHSLRHDAAFEGAFTGIPFRRSACTTRPFAKLRVHVKKEIVPLGISGVDARLTGTQVSPSDWGALIRRPDVVLLDNRNSFEFRLGHFWGAVDPQVTHFRDFPAYVRSHAAAWKAEGRQVAMYCTGGIRCEKTSAWMLSLGLPSYQLEGGILNYLQHMADAAHDWQGECFVFDNRVALDANLQETATTHEDVYRDERDGAWRLQRALRLAAAGGA